MLYLILPVGNYIGWGVLGKHLALELSELTDVRLAATLPRDETLIRDFETALLEKISLSAQTRDDILQGRIEAIDHPLIQPIAPNSLLPSGPRIKSPLNIGYVFSENTYFPPEEIRQCNDYFDVVAAGSTWCAENLHKAGVKNVEVVLQGVDSHLFNPEHSGKTHLRDKFVIFSGGKFEIRKAQDLVIRAFKAFSEKYADAVLVCAWHNGDEASLRSMEASPYISCDLSGRDFRERIAGLMRANGIDPGRVYILGSQPHSSMSRAYRNSDVGLFPNRCEGGTNLVLMEYMACGKLAIATYFSGHTDILSLENSLPLRRISPLEVRDGDHPASVWGEADLDEIITSLEWAYQNREALRSLGLRAGSDMRSLTWGDTARRFVEIAGE